MGTATSESIVSLRKERRRSAVALLLGAAVLILLIVSARAYASTTPKENGDGSQAVIPVMLPGDSKESPTAYLVSDNGASYFCMRGTEQDGRIAYTCSKLEGTEDQ